MFHVLKNHKNIIGTKKDYMAKNKKEPYEIVSNKALIGLSLSMIVIVVQTSIPSIKLVKTIKTQSKKLWHVSNAFQIPEGEKLAKKLCQKEYSKIHEHHHRDFLRHNLKKWATFS